MHQMGKFIGFVFLGAALCGCTATLSVPPDTILDRSAPATRKPPVSALMVLPPRGSERGQRSDLSDLERFLLEKGFRIISSGITGRVASGPSEVRADESSRLSDLERALILAKNSNADALLQVGEIGFSDAERHFVLPDGERANFKEVPESPTSPNAFGVRIKEAKFTFQAKLINVENGEIMVSMDISQSTSRVSPAVNMSVPLNQGHTTIKVDTSQRRKEVVFQVMDAFSDHISVRALQRPVQP